ncbi:MAG: DUF934 domain-containing protein [Alphaproteobacteria bacterium]
MPLFDGNGKEVRDEWTVLTDDAELPALRPVIVTLARWRNEKEMLIAREGGVGVVLTSEQLAGEIGDDLQHLDLVQVTFPNFADGRAYSTARLLRERFGFKGEIRAGGDVLLDQLQAMLRVGIDRFVISNEPTIRWTRKGHRPTVDLFYQPAVDAAPTIRVLRQKSYEEPARLAS